MKQQEEIETTGILFYTGTPVRDLGLQWIGDENQLHHDIR